jgi:pilus assembly protein Flp/PilA
MNFMENSQVASEVYLCRGGQLCYDTFGTNFEERRENAMLYLPREEGQGLVEYALILVLVAVVVIVILALLGPAIGNIFSNIVSSL